MSVSIVSCPSCQSLLLSDTVQCPSCQHVLHPDKASDLPQMPLHSDTTASGGETSCPDCGERVRSELVRCWKCGAFLRGEMAQTYEKMQQIPTPVTYSLAEDRAKQGPPSDSAPQTQDDEREFEGGFRSAEEEEEGFGLPDDLSAEDDDFELAPEYESEAAAPQAAEQDEWIPLKDEPPPPAPRAATVSAPALRTEPEDDDCVTYGLAQPQVSATPPAQTAAQNYATDFAETLIETPMVAAARTPPAPAPRAPTPPAPSPPAPPPSAKPTKAAETPTPAVDENAAAAMIAESRPHSEATAGDALLSIAMAEEQEVETRRKTRGTRPEGKRAARTGFIIFCPHGHQIEVHERHRGMTGRCPRCKSLFHVPAAPWVKEKEQEQSAAEAAAAGQAAEASVAQGKYKHWMLDVHLHPLDPLKLKLKAGSLEGSFEAVDLGFADGELLVVTLAKKAGGLFGSADKKKPELRESLLLQLAKDTPLAELAVAKTQLISAEHIEQVHIVQPTPAAHESMFAGIPVFGTGRIAIRVPQTEAAGELQFASFTLSEFREFVKLLSQSFQMDDFGQDSGVPLTDLFFEAKCHYSDQRLHVLQLESLEYYRADPKIELKLIGRRCEACGLVVSEDSRKKEKIGGAAGKGIAKAKCPKCTQKFGDISLYTIEGATAAPSPDQERPGASNNGPDESVSTPPSGDAESAASEMPVHAGQSA